MWTVLLLAASASTELDVGVGYRQLQVVDQHQSPLRYVGHSGQLEVGLTGRGEVLTPLVRLDLHLGRLSAAGVDRPISGDLLAGGGLQIGLLGAVNPDGDFRVSVGGVAQKRIEYGESMALHTWGVGLASVDMRVRGEIDLGRNRLMFDLGLPVLGLVTRHNYSLDPVVPGASDLVAFYRKGTRGFTAVTLQRPYGGARISVPIGGRTAFVAGLSAAYLAHAKPRPVHLLDLTATTALTFQLGENP